MSTAALTIVIPVFNGAAFVGDAVAAALAQTDPAVEVIAVDDGSTDSTPEILARFGDCLRVVRKANGGLSSARNAGIAAAHGELLVFLDADDLLSPGHAAALLAAARERPEADVFHCGYQARDFDGRPLYAQESPKPIDDDPFHQLVRHGAPHITALAARRRALDRVGPFDITLGLQEDWDYWLRLAAVGCVFHGVPGTHTIVRRRRDSMSAAAGAALVLTGLAVLERHLAGHPRCPACAETVDTGLELWLRAAVNGCARAYARRLHLRGGVGEWLGRALAVVRRPHLLPGFVAEARARFAHA